MAKVFSYDAVTFILKADGGTSEDPMTGADILAADVAGGWGIFTKDATNELYYINARLYVGTDSASYMVLSKETWITTFVAPDAATSIVLYVGSSSTVRLGVWDIAASHSKEGAIWLFCADYAVASWLRVWGNLLIYDSTLSQIGDAIARLRVLDRGTWEIKESTLAVRELRPAAYMDLTWQDAVFRWGLSGALAGHTVTRTTNRDVEYGLALTWSGTLRNFVLEYTRTKSFYVYADCTVHLIDQRGMDFTDGAGASSATVYEEYSANLISEPGAELTIIDAGDNVVATATADGSGVFAEQIVNYATHNIVAGVDTPAYQGPFTVQIAKTDYQTWEDIWAIDGPIEAEIGLLEWPEMIVAGAIDARVAPAISVEIEPAISAEVEPAISVEIEPAISAEVEPTLTSTVS